MSMTRSATPRQWHRLLNSRVFFWASRERFDTLRNAIDDGLDSIKSLLIDAKIIPPRPKCTGAKSAPDSLSESAVGYYGGDPNGIRTRVKARSFGLVGATSPHPSIFNFSPGFSMTFRKLNGPS